MKSTNKKTVTAHDVLPAYTLIRSDRHSMEIKVQPITGEIVIRIPRRTAQKTAEDFLRRNLDAVLSAVSRAKSTIPDRMHTALADEEIRILKAQADAYIPDRIRYFTDLLGLPNPDKISYTAAKQRFGSCRKYPDGRVHLCFSYRLMQYPRDAVDAVILHEVAHMRYMDHAAAFYALIRSVMPDYDLRHAKLKETENMP
jgi:predicted metal-dependent hydrolase